jgi:hypothetical protein
VNLNARKAEVDAPGAVKAKDLPRKSKNLTFIVNTYGYIALTMQAVSILSRLFILRNRQGCLLPIVFTRLD